MRATQLVKLSFDSADRELAALVANTIAEMYIESDMETRSRFTQRAGDWLAERLTTLKGSLEQSERALTAVPRPAGPARYQGPRSKRRLEADRRADARAERRHATTRRRREPSQATRKHATQRRKALRSSCARRISTGSKSWRARPQKNVAALPKQYGPEHVRMVHAERQLGEARREYPRCADTLVASFKKEYEVAAADEAATRKALAAAKGSVRDINRKEFQLEALEQDVTANRQIYEKFLNRYRETRAASDTQSSVVARVIDPAVAPTNAVQAA